MIRVCAKMMKTENEEEYAYVAAYLVRYLLYEENMALYEKLLISQ